MEYPREPFGRGAVGEDFSYASDTNAWWLTNTELMAMIAEKEALG